MRSRNIKVLLMVALIFVSVFSTTACGRDIKESAEESAADVEKSVGESAADVEKSTGESAADVEKSTGESAADVEKGTGESTEDVEKSAGESAADVDKSAQESAADAKESVEVSPELYAVYMEAVERLVNENVFPNGLEASPDEALKSENMYKIIDADGDGQAELIINYPYTTAMAEMSYYIFDYKEEGGGFHQELAEFPAVKIYDNGILIAEASHNHGRSSMDDFWPYSVYEYQEATDTYERLAWVDAWEEVIFDGAQPDVDFPHEEDIDGDGVLYYFADMETFEPATIMDNAAYMEWLKNLTADAELLQIEYEKLPYVG